MPVRESSYDFFCVACVSWVRVLVLVHPKLRPCTTVDELLPLHCVSLASVNTARVSLPRAVCTPCVSRVDSGVGVGAERSVTRRIDVGSMYIFICMAGSNIVRGNALFDEEVFRSSSASASSSAVRSMQTLSSRVTAVIWFSLAASGALPCCSAKCFSTASAVNSFSMIFPRK